MKNGPLFAALCIFSAAAPLPLDCAEIAEPDHFPIQYDKEIANSFFDTDTYDWPDNIIEHEDGRLEDGFGGDVNLAVKSLRTAELHSTSQVPHIVKQASSWIEPDGSLRLYFSNSSASTSDFLLVKVDGSWFTATYWSNPTIDGHRIQWRVSGGKLVLNNSQRKTGIRLHGYIETEAVAILQSGKELKVKLAGYFKPEVSAIPPKVVHEPH